MAVEDKANAYICEVLSSINKKEKIGLYSCIELLKNPPLDTFYYWKHLNEEDGEVAREVILNVCFLRPIRRIMFFQGRWAPFKLHRAIVKHPFSVTLEEIRLHSIAGKNDKGFSYLGKAVKYLTNLKTLTVFNMITSSFSDAPLFHNWKLGRSLKTVRIRIRLCAPNDFFTFLKQNAMNIDAFVVEVGNLSSFPSLLKVMVGISVKSEVGSLVVATRQSVNHFPQDYYRKVFPGSFSLAFHI